MSTLGISNRTNDKRTLSDSSPITSKPSCHRKRKCPLQIKQVSGQSDDLEIITIDASSSSNSDSSNDSIDISCKPRKSHGKVGGDGSRSNNRRKTIQVCPANFRRVSGSKVGGQLVSGDGVVSPTGGSLTRTSPLPHFNWADCREVWELMLQKDESYTRSSSMMVRHPSLQARMRSILIDWLSEVCEVYKLHRETFYLALDFVDRYLSTESNIPKHDLQLIGITCLLISSKIEEIYPPKLADFSFVTDGACDEADILAKELVILKSLNWDLTPMTVNGWLCVYMQLYSQLEKENSSFDSNQVQSESPKRVTRRTNSPFKEPPEDDFMIPGYPSQFFAQIAHLLDLSMLDINCLQFNYSVIAASALYHFTNETTVFQCTGLKLTAIKDCVIWMTPFALAIRDEGFENPKILKVGDSTEPIHDIQCHTADLALLEKAQDKQVQMNKDTSGNSGYFSSIDDSLSTPGGPSSASSPLTQASNFLTPPRSSSKSKV